MGEKEEDIAGILQLDFTDCAEIHVPEDYARYLDPKTSQTRSLRLSVVARTPLFSPANPKSHCPRSDFPENLDLVAAVVRAWWEMGNQFWGMFFRRLLSLLAGTRTAEPTRNLSRLFAFVIFDGEPLVTLPRGSAPI